MKRTILGLLLVLAFGFSLRAQKLGYVNVKTLKSEIPEIAKAESEVKLYQSLLFQQGVGMVKELQMEYDRVQRMVAGGCLSPRAQQKLVINCQIKHNRVEVFESDMEEMIQTFEAKLIKPILDRIDSAIQAVASEHQFKYILQEGSPFILYYDDAADVSGLVRSELGM